MATVSLQSAFDAARRALDAGAADKAVAIARYILAHFPRNIEAQRLLGEALLNAGDTEAAAESFGRVLDADPESVAAYYGRGLAFAARDDRLSAARAFEHALEIQPNLAELRTQLIRLYGETPGSSAQLRLSRAGLARLYTRGGMYGQAVDEFRAVIDADPERPDVEAALAEALWRDGQEDEAAAYCREILARRPELLKPRLLLGYLLFAAGQPDGEELWRAAAQGDPTLTVARSLFDILPPIRLEDPVLPPFDADELVARAAKSAQQTASSPSRQAVEPRALPSPVEATQQVAPLPAEANHEPEAHAPFAAEPTEPIVEQHWDGDDIAIAGAAARTYEWDARLTDDAALPSDAFSDEPPPPRDMLSDDELLASLLGIDEQPEQSNESLLSPSPGALAQPDRMKLDQPLGEATETAVQAEARPFALDDAEAYDVAPFSLEGGEAFGADSTAAPPRAFLRDDWPDRTGGGASERNEARDLGPFTLDELAFGEDDTASQTAGRSSPPAEPADPAFALGEHSRANESDAAPFAELPLATEAAAPATPEPAPEPGATRDVFSLDDLADDASSWEQGQLASPADEEQVPFSLADLGIDAEQLNAVQPPPADKAAPQGTAPLSEMPYPPTTESAPPWESYVPEASPLADVAGADHDIGARAVPPSRVPAAAPTGRQTEASSFSLADLGLTDEEIAALDLSDIELADERTNRPAEPGSTPPSAVPLVGSAGDEGAPNGLRSVFQQLEADPDNASLRLAVARISNQSDKPGQAIEHYRQLVRRGQLLGDVAADLEDLAGEADEPQLLRRLHRLLGDTYMQQNRVQDAMDQYSWTSEGDKPWNDR